MVSFGSVVLLKQYSFDFRLLSMSMDDDLEAVEDSVESSLSGWMVWTCSANLTVFVVVCAGELAHFKIERLETALLHERLVDVVCLTH